jgi:hypothetical protein
MSELVDIAVFDECLATSNGLRDRVQIPSGGALLSGDVPVPGATTQIIDPTYEFHNSGVTVNCGNINADSLA